jgi:hypothetical protein
MLPFSFMFQGFICAPSLPSSTILIVIYVSAAVPGNIGETGGLINSKTF